MKALVLSCNTGQGHNTAGRAVIEALERRGVSAEMQDALSFGGRYTSVAISGGYVKMTQIRPQMFGRLYHVGELISNPNPKLKSPIYFANALFAGKLKRFIEAGGYDTVICPHLFPAETMTWLRRRHGLNVRLYGVATDYTCSPFWEETEMDRFFIPHAQLRAEYEKKGCPSACLMETGIPVSSVFQGKTPMSEARAALGIEPNKRCFLLMSGSMGFGDVPEIAEHLLALGDADTRVLVLVGRNEKLQKELAARFGDDSRLTAVPFTKQVALYMDACDVTLTKPGGLTSTEAAVKNIPLVHTAPIPGCETENAKFFGALGISLPTHTPRESAEAAWKLAADEALRNRQLAAQRAEINPRAADDIADAMLAQADEAK